MAQTEHQWVCSGTEEQPHETTNTITSVSFATEAPAPECPTCGEKMRKVWGVAAITYDRDWYLRR